MEMASNLLDVQNLDLEGVVDDGYQHVFEAGSRISQGSVEGLGDTPGLLVNQNIGFLVIVCGSTFIPTTTLL